MNKYELLYTRIEDINPLTIEQEDSLGQYWQQVAPLIERDAWESVKQYGDWSSDCMDTFHASIESGMAYWAKEYVRTHHKSLDTNNMSIEDMVDMACEGECE